MSKKGKTFLVTIELSESFLDVFRLIEKFDDQMETGDDRLFVLVQSSLDGFETSTLDELDFQSGSIVVVA